MEAAIAQLGRASLRVERGLDGRPRTLGSLLLIEAIDVRCRLEPEEEGDASHEEEDGCDAVAPPLLAGLQSRTGRVDDSPSVTSRDVLAYCVSKFRRHRRAEGHEGDDEGRQTGKRRVDDRVNRKSAQRGEMGLQRSERAGRRCTQEWEKRGGRGGSARRSVSMRQYTSSIWPVVLHSFPECHATRVTGDREGQGGFVGRGRGAAKEESPNANRTHLEDSASTDEASDGAR